MLSKILSLVLSVCMLITSVPVGTIIDELSGMFESTDNQTTEDVTVTDKKDLPGVALLSLETPKCWHWSLYYNGKFYDPEYGLIEDFPPSNRRYFWEISAKF